MYSLRVVLSGETVVLGRLRSRGWHTVRQSAPTVWLRRPRDRPNGGRGARWRDGRPRTSFSSSLLLSSIELGDTQSL